MLEAGSLLAAAVFGQTGRCEKVRREEKGRKRERRGGDIGKLFRSLLLGCHISVLPLYLKSFLWTVETLTFEMKF